MIFLFALEKNMERNLRSSGNAEDELEWNPGTFKLCKHLHVHHSLPDCQGPRSGSPWCNGLNLLPPTQSYPALCADNNSNIRWWNQPLRSKAVGIGDFEALGLTEGTSDFCCPFVFAKSWAVQLGWEMLRNLSTELWITCCYNQLA